MTTFVLVPGANHGAWWYAPVVNALKSLGYDATALTLSGLDPEGPPAPAANLDQHIDEVVGLITMQPEPVVLVGHSYAGSVVTGVADRHPEHVTTLVYLDAFLPEDGDSCYSMTNESQRAWYLDGAGPTGLAVEPLPFFDPRARPHPLGTLLQRSRLTGAWKEVPRKIYALAADPEWLAQSPFPLTADRLRTDPCWSVIDLPATHNILKDGPDLLVNLLQHLASETPAATQRTTDTESLLERRAVVEGGRADAFGPIETADRPIGVPGPRPAEGEAEAG